MGALGALAAGAFADSGSTAAPASTGAVPTYVQQTAPDTTTPAPGTTTPAPRTAPGDPGSGNCPGMGSGSGSGSQGSGSSGQGSSTTTPS